MSEKSNGAGYPEGVPAEEKPERFDDTATEPKATEPKASEPNVSEPNVETDPGIDEVDEGTEEEILSVPSTDRDEDIPADAADGGARHEGGDATESAVEPPD